MVKTKYGGILHTASQLVQERGLLRGLILSGQ